MRQHQMKEIRKTYPNKLKVVKGLKDQAESIERLVNTAWGFACTALWNSSIFSNKEIEEAKASIRELLVNCMKPILYPGFCWLPEQ